MNTRNFRTFIAFATVVTLLFAPFVAVQANAQVAGATLSGSVTDPSGAVIPEAEVSIKNVATGVTRAVTTDKDGFYTAPNLLPGNYDVTVSAAGFTTQAQTGITLTVGAQQVLNVTMHVGQTTQTVEVTGAAEAVQLASSDISAVVNATTVRELPLNGRSWTDLATLQPGVDSIQNQIVFTDPGRGNRGFGSQLTIDGQKPVQNNYRLDGITINDYANGGPGSVIGGSLGVDAIQEFSVITSNYTAEYGRTSGGVVNAITRSGTNQIHGSGYWFLRDEDFDARNFFDIGGVPSFHRNQFGGSVGGPIRRDRTFFFADYEAIRQGKGVSQVDDVPSAAARAGNLSTGQINVDPAAAKYLGLFPLPNGPLNPGGDTGPFTIALNQTVRENFLTTRIDHKISSKDSLFGTYLYDDTPFTTPDFFGDVLLGSQTNRQIAILEESHIFSPTLVNSIRVGFNRAGVANNRGVSALNPLAADPSLGAVPGQNAAFVQISGGPTTMSGGLNALTHYFHYWNSWQVYDDAFLTRGTHSIKFGGNLERIEYNYIGYQSPGGKFLFGGLKQFLTNEPSKFEVSVTSTIGPRGLRQSLFGGYIQDDWRWRPNVTLNLGLRHEAVGIPSEVQGKLVHLNSMTDTTLHLGSPVMPNPTTRNFEPRVGFSWDPFKTGKTAVRGGFGMFDVLPLPYMYTLLQVQSYPFLQLGDATNLPPGTFFTGANAFLGVKSRSGTYIDQNPHRTYVMQWNLNVQHEVTPTLTAMVGYAGSRGIHQQFRDDDADFVIPTTTPQGLFWPTSYASGTTINPNFGSIRALFFSANSYYDAFEMAIAKKMSHGVQVQGSFTWGKSMDNTSATIAPDAFGNSISSLQWIDPKLTKGLSDFNVGRTLVINGIWQVPDWKSAPGLVGRITNGWQLGGVFKVSDGIPFTPTVGTGGDPLGLNNSDDYDFPNWLTGPGCSSPINPGNPNNYIKTQCFAVPTVASAGASAALCDTTRGQPGQCLNLRGNAGRNIIIGPGLENLDFSVFKNNYVRRISETFNVQFRAEFFNILNRANFGAPVLPNQTDLFDNNGVSLAPANGGTAGQLTTTVTTSREIQFALKLIW